ncbi:hypothetical protein E2320_011955, partial [Naja naja]
PAVQELWATYLSTLSLPQQRLPREEDTHTRAHTLLTQCATPAAVPGLALPDAGPAASGSLLLQQSLYSSSVDHLQEKIFYEAGLDRKICVSLHTSEHFLTRLSQEENSTSEPIKDTAPQLNTTLLR